MQSDPTLLNLQLRNHSKDTPGVRMEVVGSIEHGDKDRQQRLGAWISSIAELHKNKPAAVVQYTRPMPDIEGLMQVRHYSAVAASYMWLTVYARRQGCGSTAVGVHSGVRGTLNYHCGRGSESHCRYHFTRLGLSRPDSPRPMPALAAPLINPYIPSRLESVHWVVLGLLHQGIYLVFIPVLQQMKLAWLVGGCACRSGRLRWRQLYVTASCPLQTW